MASIQCTRVLATCGISLGIFAFSGCARNAYPNPYANPGYSSPWNTPAPGSAPMLPPPQTQPGALPSVPALPPPPGTPGAPAAGAVPGATAPSSWSNPGTMSQQQQRATLFDPYADNAAGPEVVGGRPREFQKPLAEPVRARGFRDTRWPF